jgi:hypothetical protein
VNQNKNNAFKAGHNNFSDWDRAEYLAILSD